MLCKFLVTLVAFVSGWAMFHAAPAMLNDVTMICGPYAAMIGLLMAPVVAQVVTLWNRGRARVTGYYGLLMAVATMNLWAIVENIKSRGVPTMQDDVPEVMATHVECLVGRIKTHFYTNTGKYLDDEAAMKLIEGTFASWRRQDARPSRDGAGDDIDYFNGSI